MTNGTINNNTKISIALVIPLIVIGGAYFVLKDKVDRIEAQYVPRNEIEIQLKSINEKLDILTKQNGK